MFYLSMFRLNSINFYSNSFTAKGYKKTEKPQVVASHKPVENSITLPHFSMQQYMLHTKPINPSRLSIFYYNDTHGNSDSMAGVINSANKFQKDSQRSASASFILSAGDNCSGGDANKNEFIFDLMQNIMGVDVSAVGNHEIDAAIDGFHDAAKNNQVTFIATNVTFDDSKKMNEVIKKSIIKEKNGVKYGFIGTMPIDFKMCTKEDVQKGLEVMDYEHTLAALQSEINNLRAQGVNRIIMLSHVGYDTDRKLASELDGVDVIIGGHTHNVIEGAKYGENIIKSKSGEPVIITQGGENGKYYGILDVEFDDKGVLSKIGNQLTPATTIAKSPVVEYIKSQKLGKSPHVGTIKEAQPLPPNRRIEPCGWTEVMADSMRSELDGDIALINSANIRKVPKAGDLTERDILESAPMKNRLYKAKLTQKQIVEAVKNAAKNTMTAQDGYPGLLQGSGFTYKIDDTGDLLEFYIIHKDGTKEAIDISNPSEDITYVTIFDNFTAKPDGEYSELVPKFGFQEFDFDKDVTMSRYLSKLPDKEDLVFKPDGRLEIIQTSKEKQKGSSIRKI